MFLCIILCTLATSSGHSITPGKHYLHISKLITNRKSPDFYNITLEPFHNVALNAGIKQNAMLNPRIIYVKGIL